MEQAIAASTLVMTVGLAVSQPRLGLREIRITPGLAAVLGVLALLLTGLLHPMDLVTSARVQWRPLLTLTAVMAMTGVVREVGAFDRLARILEARTIARGRAGRSALFVFNVVFVASVVTPSLLNNDAAILLLTPVVVTLAERLYPGNKKILHAFVFAVFLGPGVAPFVVSNPMNMIVAEFAGIGFNAYAALMVPISIAGAVVTYAILRWVYRRDLATLSAPRSLSPAYAAAPHAAEKPALFLLLAVFAAYPITAALGAPIWIVAVVGAALSLALAARYRVATMKKVAGHVSFDILAFLWGVFLVVAALRSAGLGDRLAALYHAHDGGTQIAVVGTMAALGSAVVDNHPMSVLNMMALGNHDGARPLLAALVGGDIGPRLLPIGSLAGLLWMDLLKRRGIDIGIGTFVRLGTLVLVPTLTISLFLLWAL